MKNKQSAVVAAFSVALLFGSGVAHAREGWYVGFGGGQASIKQDLCAGSELAFDPGTSACSAETTDTALKIFGGYQFNPVGALELSYVNLGKVSFDASGTVALTPSSLHGEWKADGVALEGVATLPVTRRFGFLARIGFFNWNAELTASGSGYYAGYGSVSDSGTDLTYGVGIKLDLPNQLGLRAEWQRFQDVGNDSTTGRSDVDLLSVSVLVRF